MQGLPLKNNSPPMKGAKGFTLIELMVVLLISSVIMTAVYKIFIAQQKAYVGQEFVVETQQNFRAAVNVMGKEIRLAGHSDDYINLPVGTDCLTSPGVCIGSGASSLAFTYIDEDRLTDGQDNDNDGHQDGMDPDEKWVWVEYDLYDAYANGSNDLGRKIGVGTNIGAGTHDAVVTDIHGLEFRYLKVNAVSGAIEYADSVDAGNMRDIRGVEITLLARAAGDERDQNFQTNFTTPKGTPWTLPNGVRGRMLTTTVMCRNLNL